MIIAHPPCTYLAASGATSLYSKDHRIKDPERLEKGMQAKKFFEAFLNADCPRVAVENPMPMKIFGLPPCSQVIEPYMFGDPWRKRTYLWLRGLPLLMATDIVVPMGLWVANTSVKKDPSIKTRYPLPSNRDPKIRSKTFPGIARAMADQWGG